MTPRGLINRNVWASFAAALAALMTAAPARAQTAPAPRSDAVAYIIAHPADYDAAFAYIRASIDAGDQEAAIAALERLLFFNPGLTRAKYELGNLYFKLASNAMAARYFEESLAAGDLDPDLRRRAETYLPMARKELAPDRVYGLLETGVRFNSNPALMPAPGLLNGFFTAVPGGAKYKGATDTAAFVLADARYVHDFQNERGDIFEVRALGYATAQFRFQELNVGLLNLTFGPRLALAPEALPGVTIHPYGAFSVSSIGGSIYGSALGGGVSLGIPIGARFSLEPGAEWLGVSINDPNAQTSNALISAGRVWTESVAAKWTPVDWLTLNAKAFVSDNLATNRLLSSRQAGYEASVKFDFDPPAASMPLQWSLTPFARYATANFSAVNGFLPLAVRRRDELWRAGSQLDMPINATFGLTAVAQYMKNGSNDALFSSAAWSASLGATVRF